MSIKHVLSIVIISLLAIQVSAEELSDSLSQSDTIYFDDGSLYIGEIADSLFNGYGRMVYADSTIYEGEWKDGLWDGQGELFYPDGDYYKGHFSRHEFSGYGIYLYSDGSKYDGYWEYGMYNGAGTMDYANGSTYTGNWIADKKNGPGVYYDSFTGTLFKGFFSDDLIMYQYGDSNTLSDTPRKSQVVDDGKFHYCNLVTISLSYGMGQILSLHGDYHITDSFFAGMQLGFNTVTHEIGKESVTVDEETGEKITLVDWDWYPDEILTENEYPFFKISAECGISWRRFSLGTALGLGVDNTVRNCRSKESNDSYFEPGTLYFRSKVTGVRFSYDIFTEFVPDINLHWIDISLRAGYSNLNSFYLGLGVVF